jgi:hypothetical protein
MSFLDSIVSRRFRDEQAGRVIVFPWDRPYLVRSESDELKIKTFLKMFYFAFFYMVVLGILFNAWFLFLFNLLETGSSPAHTEYSAAIFNCVAYCLFVGVPFALLLRSYKKALPNLVSKQDEVAVPNAHPDWRIWLLAAALGLALAALGILLLMRPR